MTRTTDELLDELHDYVDGSSAANLGPTEATKSSLQLITEILQRLLAEVPDA